MNLIIDKEMEIFIDKLKERNIPVIIELDDSIARRMFYKPQNCMWTGIHILREDEKHHPLQKYSELILVERAGIIAAGLYDKLIEDQYWQSLEIDKIDIYTKDTISTVKQFYEATREDMINPNENFPPYDLETDIILKDCYMNIYIKQQEAIGKKFLYY